MHSEVAASNVTHAIRDAAALIRSARYLTAFTGAGISVESGIPPFRGPGGLWSKYDPRMLELDYFHRNPDKAWPNKAHEVLAAWEARGLLKTLITQNIDNLHREAGIQELPILLRLPG